MRSYAGLAGRMQFLPSPLKGYAYPVPPGGAGPPTPWDVTDAVYVAARMMLLGLLGWSVRVAI